MSELYRGLTIPEYLDAADGPSGFKALIDSGPIPRFASTGDRDGALSAPAEGAMCYVTGIGVQYHNGTSWTSVTDGGTPAAHTHSAGDITSGVLADARLPSGSTTDRGIVQLSDSPTSTSTTLAATANAVKQAYDRAGHAHSYLALSGGTISGNLAVTGTLGVNGTLTMSGSGFVNGYKANKGELQVRNVMTTDSIANVSDATGKAGDVIHVYAAGGNNGTYVRSTYNGGLNGTYWHKAE